MFSGFHKTVITLVVMVIFYTTDFLLLSRYDRERRAEGSGRSWDFTVMVVIVAAFLVVQPALLPWLGLHTDAWWGGLLQAVGIFLLLGAFGLHWWARVHLRQFYAGRAEIQPEHRPVTSGPYAYIRHLTFVSFFMFALDWYWSTPLCLRWWQPSTRSGISLGLRDRRRNCLPRTCLVTPTI